MAKKLYTCIVILTDGTARIRKNWANPDIIPQWLNSNGLDWKEINVYPKPTIKGEKPPCDRKIINPDYKKKETP